MKSLYCSNCGKELVFMQKAIPIHQKVITVVEPHTCSESDLNDHPLTQKPSFDNFRPRTEILNEGKFVKKLNDLTPLPREQSGDKRDDSHIRKEKSTAPISILEKINSLTTSNPEGDINDYSDEEA